jgi:hypothetical protein
VPDIGGGRSGGDPGAQTQPGRPHFDGLRSGDGGAAFGSIVAAILTVRVRCYTLFCERHKNHWRFRTLIIWGAFVAILVFLFGGIALVGLLSERLSESTQDRLFGSVCIASPMLLLFWLISIPVIQLTSIHPADVTERRLTLKRISPAFAEAVREHRKNKQAEEEPDNHPREHRIRRSPPNRRDHET